MYIVQNLSSIASYVILHTEICIHTLHSCALAPYIGELIPYCVPESVWLVPFSTSRSTLDLKARPVVLLQSESCLLSALWPLKGVHVFNTLS